MMALVKYETKKIFGQIKGNALTAIIVAAFFSWEDILASRKQTGQTPSGFGKF